MNDYKVETRKRGQTLLIVEGYHEKNALFKLLFECFPEINIDIDDVWIYGTNIYLLYEDIVKEYGENWTNDDIDIDLPFVISRKQSPDSLKYKYDFTNIFLVFDYERHDPNFSESKILSMQRKLSDAADMGKLYINYPMIESYQHFKSLPDSEYRNRKIPVNLRPGSEYKSLVSKETVISNVVDFPRRINDFVEKRYGVEDDIVRNKCCDEILQISTDDNLLGNIENIFLDVLDSERLNTLKHLLNDWVTKIGYVYERKTYYQYLKDIFVSIICHNIRKANWIQNGQYKLKGNEYKACFEHLDFSRILDIQNNFSKDEVEGYIWVLNTCVFIVPDYNFALIQYPGAI